MKRIIITVLMVALMSVAAFADAPRTISVQGKLTDASGNPITTSVNIGFGIYNVQSGGAPIWSAVQSITPSTSGVFNALLIVPALDFNSQYWLGLNVSNQVLSPRINLTSSAYAINTERFGGQLPTYYNNLFVNAAGDTMTGPLSITSTDAGGGLKVGITGNVPSATGTIVLGDTYITKTYGYNLYTPAAFESGWALKAPQICIGTDCRAVWPSGGGVASCSDCDSRFFNPGAEPLDMAGYNIYNANTVQTGTLTTPEERQAISYMSFLAYL